MSYNNGPKIATDGLVLCLDAGNPKSYSGSGTAWTDISRNGNSGTLTNGPTFSSANGGSIVFDGTNDHINISTNPSSFFSNTFTHTAWINYISERGTFHGVFWGEGSTGGGSGLQLLLSFVSVNTVNCYAHYRINNVTTGWGETNTSAFGTSLLGKWTHVAWSFNSGTTIIYLNGNLVHSNSSRGSYSGGTTSPFFLGTRNDGLFGSNMRMASTDCYNRALSSSEILQNYNATKGRFGL